MPWTENSDQKDHKSWMIRVWILPTLPITAIIRNTPPASCKVRWIQPPSSPFDFAHVTRMAPSVVKSTETRGASIPKQAN